MPRTDFTQFPTQKEYKTIISKQATRPLPSAKKAKHYPDFSTIIQLLNYLKIDNRLFVQKFSPNDLLKTDLVTQEIDLIYQKTIDGILKKSKNGLKIYNKLYDYLSEEDEIGKADLIFVFGAKTFARIDKAIQLYKRNYSKLILISGQGPIYRQKSKKPEARAQKYYAVKKGIPRQDILTETKSITVLDNVLRSLNLLGKMNIKYSSIILSNSPYVQRRGWCHFKKYLPNQIKLIRANSSTKDEFKRQNWYKNKKGIKAVLNEFIKMKIEVILNNT